MRNAFAKTIYELAKEDERICVLVADISPAGAMEEFRRDFLDRFINVGIAEQAMIGVAAGLAMRGMRPFCYTIATFALFRAYEFIRCDLAYQDLPVTVVGMGAGLAYSTLGGTHQAIEDIAVAMACPNLTVLAPCDPRETAECARWCAQRESSGPVYLRIGKAGEPDLTAGAAPWRAGALRPLPAALPPSRTCILAYGPTASIAVRVAKELRADVILVPTLAPAPIAELAKLSSRYGRCIVIEEASCAPLAALLREDLIRTSFSEAVLLSFALPRAFPHGCGSREELLAAAGLTAEKILEQVR